MKQETKCLLMILALVLAVILAFTGCVHLIYSK